MVVFRSSQHTSKLYLLALVAGISLIVPQVLAVRCVNCACPGQVTGFALWDAPKKIKEFDIQDGDIICPASDEVNIEAIAENCRRGRIRSVFLEMTGPVANSRNNNNKKYFLWGNQGARRGKIFSGGRLLDGIYTITATPYSKRFSKGKAGTPMTVSFTVDCMHQISCVEQSLALQRAGVTIDANGDFLPAAAVLLELAARAPGVADALSGYLQIIGQVNALLARDSILPEPLATEFVARQEALQAVIVGYTVGDLAYLDQRPSLGLTDEPNLARSRSRGLQNDQKRKVYFAIYYEVPDKAFERAANTYKSEIEARPDFDATRDVVITGGFQTEKQFRSQWDNLKTAGDGSQEGMSEGIIFSHASKGGNNDGLEFKPGGTNPTADNDGTLGQNEMGILPKLKWTNDGKMHLASCNSGNDGSRGWTPAQEFANRQGVPVSGEDGYAYFSTSPSTYKETTPQDQKIYLTAYKRGKNGWWGFGSVIPWVVKQPNQTPSPPTPTPPSPSPPTGWWSGVFGDPHLSTFDRLQFDCQAFGLFTMVTSLETPGFRIQERFTSVGGSGLCSQASVSTGIVVGEIGLPTIQVSIPDGAVTDPSGTIGACPVDLYEDGQREDLLTYAGPPGIALSISGSRITVSYPSTGVQVHLQLRESSSFGCFLLVQVFLPITYRSNETVLGLLGTPNDSGADDWVAPDGTLYLAPINEAQRIFSPAYNYCVTNWCIRNETESIFTFRPGESFTATTGCDETYSEEIEDAVLNAPPELVAICGSSTNLACIVEGVCGNLDDARQVQRDEQEVEKEQKDANPFFCDDVDLCTADSFDESNGTCVFTPINCPEGQSCDSRDGTCKNVSGVAPCIAVIDENDSFSDAQMNALWEEFREKYPDRPFCLLRPGTAEKLYLPIAFQSDPLTVFRQVNRDGESASVSPSNWFDICGLQRLFSTGIGFVGLFVDNSGSMTTSTVQGSFDQFVATLEANDLEFTTLFNNQENWIEPFLVELAPPQ